MNSLNYRTMKKLLIVLVLMIGTAGCGDDFLNTSPYDSLGENQFWQNEEHAMAGVTGVYQNLRYDNVYGSFYGRDAMTPTVLGYDRFQAFNMGIVSNRDGLFLNTWRELYRGIQRANDVLDRLPDIPDLSEEKRTRFTAETKFLRALHYFNLLDVFGGVPIYDEPVLVEDAERPRNSEEEVREFILSDLNEAIRDLPDVVPASEFGRATRGAAIALRGKVFLYNEQWAEAEADFREVMQMGLYDLHSDYAELFTEANETSNEIIFSLQHIDEPGLGSNIQLALGSRSAEGSNWNNYVATNELVDSYENTDGSEFDWNEVVPGFDSMSREERAVVFLRDDLTESEREQYLSSPELEDLYIEGGNEERVKQAWENRDQRLNATVILPYTTFFGAQDIDYTLRWPYRREAGPEHDLRTNWTGSAVYPWRKFVFTGSDLVNRLHGPTDYPIIRYADVLLMFAEARNENTGLDQEVLNAINKVRARAGIAELQNSDASLPTYVGTSDQMRERIRHERSVEFVLEGIYYSDIRRWNIGDEVNNYDIRLFDGSHFRTRVWQPHYNLWPIPPVEIEQNRDLTQNPGWES